MEEQTRQLFFIIFALLLGVTSLAVVFFFVYKSYKKNNSVLKEDEDVHGGMAHYNCPKCNQQMEKGYAVAGRGIIYQKEDSKPISPFSTILSVLDNTMSLSFQPAVNRAWHCNTCKYLILDHSKLIKRTKK